MEDLVDCVEKTVTLRAKLDEYEVFLIAEPEVISYGELQDLLGEQIHGTEWPTIRIPKVVAKAGAWAKEKMAGETETVFIKPWMIELADDHYPVAIEHARARLVWEPKRSLRRTLPVMVERLKQDPEQWYKRHGLKLSKPDARTKGLSGR